MTARMVEEAENRLHELPQDEWSSIVLEGFALALALVCAVQGADLLTGYTANPLYDDQLPEEGARAQFRHIRAGFRPRRGG
jgi:hypothetical protein